MATWVNLSVDSFKAATRLRDRHNRSCVSRAYYAAYAAVTHELTKSPGITLDYGGNNPKHGKLTNYIQAGFSNLSHQQSLINEIDSALRNLRRDRERSDYMPSEEIGQAEAKDNLRLAEQVILSLGIPL